MNRPAASRSFPANVVSQRLRLFLWVDGLLTVLCLVAELICYRLGFDKQYWKPWFIGVKFNDFLSYAPRFHYLHQARFFDFNTIPWPFAYPAPAAAIYALFFALGSRFSLMVFLAASLAIFVAASLLFRKRLVARGLPGRGSYAKVALGVLLAFPFWFCVQRGNIEIVVWMFLALGVWALTRGRGYSAAACFGVAASLKLVPFVYLALLVPRRQYRQIGFGIALFAVLTAAGYAFIGPTVPAAFHGIQAGLGAFNQEFLTRFEIKSAGFDHTVVGIYRRIFDPTPRFAVLLHRYTVATAILGSLLWLIRIRVLPFLNQLIALVVAALWLVPVSFEYTLIHLYVGIACLLLATLTSPAAERDLTPLLVLLAALCAPLTEIVHHGWTYGGQLQSGLLALVFAYVLVRRLPSHFDSPSPAA